MKAETLEEFRARLAADFDRPAFVVTQEVYDAVAAFEAAARRSRISRMHREYRRKRR